MNVDLLFRIAAVGIVVALLSQLLIKTDRSEHAVMLSIAGIVIVLLMLVSGIGELFDTMKNVFGL